MSGEKTEEPTQKKLEDQRREGQLPQRKNVVEAMSLTSSVLLLYALFGRSSEAMLALTRTALDAVRQDFATGLQFSLDAAGDQILLLLSFCAAASLFTLMSGLFLNRFNFAAKAMAPKFQKLNPVNGLKSLFSKSTLYNFLRLVTYFCALATLLYFTVRGGIPEVVNASHCGPVCLDPLFREQLKTTVAVILAVLMLLAILDYRIQTALFRSQNKMSKDEVKREHKGQEGDPQVKGERKSIAMSDAHQPGPKDATHVVYSDELLVAIIYHAEARQRPFVVAKAKGPGISRLRMRFASLHIPTFHLPSVAADFHRMASVGRYLPPQSAIGMEKILRAKPIPTQ